jgi:hypothetical protein
VTWLRRPALNRYAYNGKVGVDIERQGVPSKWVTLRALAVLPDEELWVPGQGRA